MKKRKSNHKKYKFTYIKSTVFTLFILTLFMRGYTTLESTGENYFHIQVNGHEVGVLGDRAEAEQLLIQARKNVASASDELVFIEAEMDITGEEVLWGWVDDEEMVLANMEEVLRSSILQTMHRSYTLKVNEYIVNLGSVEEVNQLLQAAVDKYDSEHKFRVELVYDNSREFNVLTTNIVNSDILMENGEEIVQTAGIQSYFNSTDAEAVVDEELDFDDYDLGIHDMDFSEEVEIVESYLPESQLTLLSDAIDQVTKDQEVPSEYVVVSGDTLSAIAIKVDIPMDDIVAMNDSLESTESVLQIGQKLVITIPEPELSVTRVEQRYYDEFYDAEVQYIDNDDWYTTKTVVHVQPSAGYRKVVVEVTYLNDKEVSREILKEEIVVEAVAMVVERGTKIPPTYIRPISGGRRTSGFGYRNINYPGATNNHKGVDWATPTGTSVYASSGGKVSRAGWGGGYGYVIYIDHPDGRQTRYAHLSKVLVSVGQTVKQGDRIALSGSTGASTGPHLHFELLINGVQVDPEKYGF